MNRVRYILLDVSCKMFIIVEVIMLKDAEFIRKSIEYLNQYIQTSLQKKVERTGITVPQMRVITEVVSHQGISIKQISLNLPMTQSTVSGIVERLINKGILIKRTNSNDKRAVQIYPSDNVTKFLEKDRMEYVNQSLSDALSKLNPDKYDVVLEGIGLLVNAIKECSNE